MESLSVVVLRPFVGFLAVGILWGATNPFIKKGSIGVENVKVPPNGLKVYHELKFLILKWQYMLPFLLNQCGSVLYFLLLESADLTIAVTVTNSCTFVITALCGWALGEEQLQTRTFLGMLLAACGLTLCIWDKM